VNPPVSVVRTMFLLQDVTETICTAHAGGALMPAIQKSMICRQVPSCFSHCKVKLIEKVMLPAILHLWLACHPHHKHSLKAEQPDSAHMMLLEYVQLFIRSYYLIVRVCLQNSLQEPMHAYPVLPMCARLHLPSHHLYHGHSHLSTQQPWNIVHCQLITSDAKSASAGKAAAV